MGDRGSPSHHPGETGDDPSATVRQPTLRPRGTGGRLGAVIAPMTSFYIGLIAAFAGEITVACYDNLSAFSHIRLPIGSPGAYCVNGLALGLAAGLTAGYFNRRLPARGLRWSSIGFIFGTLAGLLLAFVLWVTASSPYHGTQYGIESGLTDLVSVGFGVAFFQAMWGSFLLSRLWLAVAGIMPFRTMRFLHDAHVNRGVLRQVGAFYQFRHIELQRYLARKINDGT